MKNAKEETWKNDEMINYLHIAIPVMRNYRGMIVRGLDKAFEVGLITQRERDIMYFRHIEWKSLSECAVKFNLTRGRIAQIEAKVLEKFRCNKK